MGNSPAGRALLENADVLAHICHLVEPSYVYRCRRVCKRCCEAVDRQRCVSTLVFPSALIRAVPAEAVSQRGDDCASLPLPCWGKTGEFSCIEERLGTRALANCVAYPMPVEEEAAPPSRFYPKSKVCRLKVKEFIPAARLGSKWNSHRVSVPGWLIQGACRGQIKCLQYGDQLCDLLEEVRYKRARYKAIRCSNFFVFAELFDEKRLQREASKKPESGAPPLLMGLVDCLALWMHPAMFSQVEELSFTSYTLEMNCPSQMYEGTEFEVTDSNHWPCWMEYASRILGPLLSMNDKGSCGLKKLSLEGPNGKLVTDILFDSLKVELPLLTHLAIDDGIAFTEHSRSQTPATETLKKFGKLPNLEKLIGLRSFGSLNSTIDELIENGFYPKLRTFTWHSYVKPWLLRRIPVRNSRPSLEFSYRFFAGSDLQHPLPEQCCLIEAYFLPPLSGDALVLPASTQRVVIEVNDHLPTIVNLRFAENLKIREVVLRYPDGYIASDQVSQKFREFADRAPKQLLEADTILLVTYKKLSFSS